MDASSALLQPPIGLKSSNLLETSRILFWDAMCIEFASTTHSTCQQIFFLRMLSFQYSMESIPLLVTLLHYDVNYIQGYICALVSGFPICERTGEQSKWSEQEGSKQSERACEERWRTNKWANEWPLWKTPFRVSQVIVDWCTNRNNAYTEKKTSCPFPTYTHWIKLDYKWSIFGLELLGKRLLKKVSRSKIDH